MSSRQQFEEDLTFFLSRLTMDSDEQVKNKLNFLKNCLVDLTERKHRKDQPFRDGAWLRQVPG